MVLVSMVLAIGLIELDRQGGAALEARWPRVFETGPEGSRTLLSAIATSMITVAGIAFSMTMVALSLAANQYSSRVVRNVMRDRSTQFVLGTFVSIFVYCLLVLRTIRGGEHEMVPVVSVLGAMIFSLIGIAVLIFFIHHVASSIQVTSILASISEETLASLGTLYPERIGDEQVEPIQAEAERNWLSNQTWHSVLSDCSGYIQTVRPDGLLDLANRHRCVIWLQRSVGDFVQKGAEIARVNQSQQAAEQLTREINACLGVNFYRTIEQDPGFGIRQMVDIALKALSPGINDPTTATNCLDHLQPVLHQLVQRRIPSPVRYQNTELRVIAPRPSFEFLLEQILRELLVAARNHYFVVRRMMDMLLSVATDTRTVRRRQLLGWYGKLICQEASMHLCQADNREIAPRLHELHATLKLSSSGLDGFEHEPLNCSFPDAWGKTLSESRAPAPANSN